MMLPWVGFFCVMSEGTTNFCYDSNHVVEQHAGMQLGPLVVYIPQMVFQYQS